MERDPRTQLTVQATPSTNGLRVAVYGELDMGSADEFYNLVLKDQSDGQNLILDLAGLTFCDSSGINRLIHLRQHQSNTGGTLRIINLTDQVRRVIEITGLAEYLGINDPVP